MLFAFDGTCSKDELDPNEDTNAVKIKEAYLGETFYQTGVGSGGLLDMIFGGAFGWGGKGRVKKAIKHLGVHPKQQNIDVVGFSRGAALALDFCNKIEKLGYKVRCLMLFDVVGSFGIAGNDINIGYDLSAPTNCEHIFHAMALHERRELFPLTRVKGAKELWFNGYHADIGGGNGNTGLNAITLSWMLEHALSCGLVLDGKKIHEAVENIDHRAKPKQPFDLVESESSESRRILIGDGVYK